MRDLNLKKMHVNLSMNNFVDFRFEKHMPSMMSMIGTELKPGNIWENAELPRLKANPKITEITVIDPKTGIEKIIFERKTP